MRSAYEPIDAGYRSRARDLARWGHGRGSASAAAESAGLFRDLRRVLKLSLPQIALRLGTRIEVIEALETGNARRLPPWPETVRVVTAYTGLARIDPRPVLAIIHDEMVLAAAAREELGATRPLLRARALLLAITAPVAAALSAAAGALAIGRNAARAARVAAAGRRRDAENPGRKRLLLLLLAGGAPLLLGTALARPGMLEATVSALPSPLARLVRGIEDYALQHMAPTHDGLKWIEVDDPRTRRTDKLQSSRN